MVPGGERAGDLAVCEAVGRVALSVFGDPGEGDGANPGPKHDARARLERAIGRDDLDAFPRRSERGESAGTLVPGEDLGRSGSDIRLFDEGRHVCISPLDDPAIWVRFDVPACLVQKTEI